MPPGRRLLCRRQAVGSTDNARAAGSACRRLPTQLAPVLLVGHRVDSEAPVFGRLAVAHVADIEVLALKLRPLRFTVWVAAVAG